MNIHRMPKLADIFKPNDAVERKKKAQEKRQQKNHARKKKQQRRKQEHRSSIHQTKFNAETFHCVSSKCKWFSSCAIILSSSSRAFSGVIYPKCRDQMRWEVFPSSISFYVNAFSLSFVRQSLLLLSVLIWFYICMPSHRWYICRKCFVSKKWEHQNDLISVCWCGPSKAIFNDKMTIKYDLKRRRKMFSSSYELAFRSIENCDSGKIFVIECLFHTKKGKNEIESKKTVWTWRDERHERQQQKQYDQQQQKRMEINENSVFTCQRFIWCRLSFLSVFFSLTCVFLAE